MSRVLLLTSSFVPHKIIGWDHALKLMFNDPPKATVVEETDEIIYRNDATDTIVQMPSVVRLLRPIDGMKRAIKFSRTNVLARDGYRCGYCGLPKKARELNYDHVVPRHRGGKTTWTNITSSCYPCNARKANRTPEQAGMRLLHKPQKPTSLPVTVPRFDPKEIPAAWVDWVRDFFVDDAVA